MKVSSPALSHKSDLGLVRLGVSGAGNVRRTFDELMDAATRETGRDALEGVLVCEQHSGGVEMVVGISRDPLFGPVVMVGVARTPIGGLQGDFASLAASGSESCRARHVFNCRVTKR